MNTLPIIRAAIEAAAATSGPGTVRASFALGQVLDRLDLPAELSPRIVVRLLRPVLARIIHELYLSGVGAELPADSIVGIIRRALEVAHADGKERAEAIEDAADAAIDALDAAIEPKGRFGELATDLALRGGLRPILVELAEEGADAIAEFTADAKPVKKSRKKAAADEE